MTPRIRKKDKHSTAAGLQFAREAAADLAAATARRAQALHRASQIGGSPAEFLDALEAYGAGQAAADEAMARLYGALRLAGASVYGLAQASRCRTATVTARIRANPAAALWADARSCDLERVEGRWVARGRHEVPDDALDALLRGGGVL